MTEVIFFGLKLAAAALFTAGIMIVLGSISSLIAHCSFFPDWVLSVLDLSIKCAAIGAAYRLFFA